MRRPSISLEHASETFTALRAPGFRPAPTIIRTLGLESEQELDGAQSAGG